MFRTVHGKSILGWYIIFASLMRCQEQEREQNHDDAWGSIHGFRNPLGQLIVLAWPAKYVQVGRSLRLLRSDNEQKSSKNDAHPNNNTHNVYNVRTVQYVIVIIIIITVNNSDNITYTHPQLILPGRMHIDMCLWLCISCMQVHVHAPIHSEQNFGCGCLDMAA